MAKIQTQGWGFTSLSSKSWKIAAGVGGVAAVGSAALFAWLVAVSLSDSARFATLSTTSGTYINRGGSHEVSDVGAIVGPSVTIFLVGCLLIGIADVSRRRLSAAAASGGAESAVRPISSPWKSLWIALLGIAWVLVAPAQWIAGVLSSAAGAAAAAGLFLVPAIISSATLAALMVAVLPTADRLSGRGVRRPDLACAAIGGALLGVCVWPLASGAIALAVAFTVFGVALIGVGVWLRRRQGA